MLLMMVLFLLAATHAAVFGGMLLHSVVHDGAPLLLAPHHTNGMGLRFLQEGLSPQEKRIRKQVQVDT